MHERAVVLYHFIEPGDVDLGTGKWVDVLEIDPYEHRPAGARVFPHRPQIDGQPHLFPGVKRHEIVHRDDGPDDPGLHPAEQEIGRKLRGVRGVAHVKALDRVVKIPPTDHEGRVRAVAQDDEQLMVLFNQSCRHGRRRLFFLFAAGDKKKLAAYGHEDKYAHNRHNIILPYSAIESNDAGLVSTRSATTPILRNDGVISKNGSPRFYKGPRTLPGQGRFWLY